jgi:predicted anti-sigma-YlaC factor YlaD
MDCEQYREAISAGLDGEDTGVPADLVARHLARCPSCRVLAERMGQVARAARLYPAEAVPDLTEVILGAVAADPAPGIAARRRRPAAAIAGDGGGAPGIIRFALLLVAAAQVLAAVPALFGDDLGATIHVAHEQGAWGVGLAAGLAFAAWRPPRAGALVPLLGAFVACLGLMTALDIAAGRVVPSAEVPHLMAAVGLALVWLESRPKPFPRRWPRPGAGSAPA